MSIPKDPDIWLEDITLPRQFPHGWLGALGFASAALQLEDRDKWIGWKFDHRQKYLHYVINMNRFLIRPNVHCQNLHPKY